MLETTISVSADLADEDIHDLTFRISRTMENEINVEARPASAPAAPGTKAVDVPLLGQIALTVLGSGGIAVTFLQVIKTYIAQTASLEVVLERGAGKEQKRLKIKAENLNPEQIEQTQALARDFFGE